MVSRNCLLINEDESALHELADLLSHQRQVSGTFTADSVSSARKILAEQKIDLLFLRVKAWDEYRKILPLLSVPPPIVIFLSGPKERSTLRLEKEVDFHLSSPYRASAINSLFARLNDPSFVPRALDFFFLKADRQYYAVAFSTLRAVSSKGRMLTVQTDHAAYQIAGTLSGLQDRLPPLFCRVGPSLLVAGQGVMGGRPAGRSSKLFGFY
jgi:two-component system, LytTR family, response regulator LytT